MKLKCRCGMNLDLSTPLGAGVVSPMSTEAMQRALASAAGTLGWTKHEGFWFCSRCAPAPGAAS